FNGTATDRLVRIDFTMGQFADKGGATNFASTETFGLYSTTGGNKTAAAPLTGKLPTGNGGVLNLDTVNLRQYIDVTMAPVGHTVTGVTATDVTLSGTGVGTAQIDSSMTPISLGGNTYRFLLRGN